MMTVALMLNVLMISEGFGRNAAAGSAAADTTDPGPGTGLYGAGKGPSPVLLGKAGDYAILAKTGISTTGTTAITGNIGVSPVAASYITGFDLIDPPSTYATSAKVTGKVYAADYDSPTPSNLTTAVSDMETAYTDAAGRAPDYTELGAGNIGGMTLAPAVYKWSTDLLIPSDVTLLGGPYDVWIFEIAGNITQTSGVKITLHGGALSKNIFWQVAGSSTHETTSHFHGILLSQTAIILKTGASFNGRLLAQSAVVLDANTLVQPDMSVEPGTATLKVMVKNSADSTPIAAAMVVLKRGSVIIDSSRADSVGLCTFSNLPAAANYSLVAGAPAFFQTGTTFTLSAGTTRTLNVYLVHKAQGILTGTVKNASHDPIANALVVLRRGSAKDPILDSTRTNASGAYTFKNVEPGAPNYWITVTATSGTMTKDSILVASGGTVTTNFVFAPTSLNPMAAYGSGKIRFTSAGNRLTVDLGVASSSRTLSIFGTDGILKLQVPVPAGQTRASVPSTLSPVKGYLYQVK